MADHLLLDDKVTMQFEDCIVAFEKATRCELRIHIEEENDTPVLDRAAFVFDHLGMRKTKERNAILIYIQVYPSALAIIGDVGVQSHVSQSHWENWKNIMVDAFKKAEYFQGIQAATVAMADQLKVAFPWNASDTDELSNSISRAK
ncbi:MAG: hypothetical protein RLY35_1893 [Bacteroidota bacterium]|jgi:uncharacterized membrane protein